MTHATVFVVVGGARSDYVRRDSMPFLAGLARQGISGSLDSPPGFEHGTALFTGTYPDASQTWGSFAYDPDESPFGWVRRLGPIANLVRPRRTFVPLRLAIKKMTRSITKASNTDPAWIPPRLLPYFRPSDAKRPLDGQGALGKRSLFDLCRANGLRYRYVSRPEDHDDDAVYDELVRDLRASAPYDLHAVRLNVLERKGHQNGPFDPALQSADLRRLDQRLASIHAALVAGYDSWDLFVVGDHGMAPVERRVNVVKALSRADAEQGKDYVVLVHSTFALLWYLTERGKNAIEAILPDVAATRVVGPEERHRLRIPSGRKWGDSMLAADPGVLFWPDFFHTTNPTMRGMHGYLDKATETHGTAVLMMSDGESTARDVGLRPLVDVFPTLCDLLNIHVPAGQEGASLVGLVRMHPPNSTKAFSAEPISQESSHA